METICEVGSKSVNGFKQPNSLHLNQSAEVEGLCYKKKKKKRKKEKKIETCSWLHFPRISTSSFEIDLILPGKLSPKRKKMKCFIFN